MRFIPLVISVIMLVGISAVCSGLNVALMSLSLADLKRKAKLGNRQAKRVLALRRNYHLTLASILLTNVGAVSATSLVLERRMNGIIAGIVATLLIVIFGEIAPQAFFARYALSFCSRLAPLMRFMIIVTYPVSRPLQLVLDKIFGYEETQLQTRHELGIMFGEHLQRSDSELDEDEVEIIRGALQLSEKRVRDIMTPIGDVFWVTPDTAINAKKIDEIKTNGYSRIPIFNRSLNRCFGVLLMKDMVDINFDEQSYRADEFPVRESELVGSMTALDTMFRKFMTSQTHLLPIERDGKIVGIVTIEDLVEEILGHEIRDETDHSNHRK